MERAPSSSSPVGPSGHTGFDLAPAELYLGRRSSMELRLVLPVLGIKGKMRAPVKDKRALALQVMQQQNLGDADLEIMVDDAAMMSGKGGATLMEGSLRRVLHAVPGGSLSAPNPRIDIGFLGSGVLLGRPAVPDRSTLPTGQGIDASGSTAGAGIGATNRVIGATVDAPRGSTESSGGGRSGPGEGATQDPIPLATPPQPHSTGAREADFSANDVARLFHVLSDPANGDALRRAYQPLSRAELDKERVILWTSVVGPIFNQTSYRPTPPALIDGIMETDLRGIDPNRHSGARLGSKLEGHFRTLRSLYTVAVANYARSGQNEPTFKSFAQGDHRLLYIHCLLKGSDAVDFVLRTIPVGAQSEVGLPGSGQVGGTPPKPPKRAKVAQVVINGMDGLTSALSGVARAMAPASSTATDASDIYDNAEAIGAVTKQLRAARQDLTADPDDRIAARVFHHLESQLARLLG